jgi:branched-chain amino acid transport system ATP-binding protein
MPENRRIATDPGVLENLETGRRRPGEAPDAAPVPAWTSERLFASFPDLDGAARRRADEMAGMILALKVQGVSILLSEQDTHFAALVADRACVLEKGEVRFRGPMAELAANAEVRRQFLDL